MAGSATTELIVKLTTPGAEKLPGLSRAFGQFGRDVNKAGLNVKKLSAELKQQESTNLKSINNTRALANSWRELAASVEFGSQEFKEATAEAKRLNIELQKMEGKTKTKGAGNLGRFARSAGAVAAGGIFGGPEGALGAGIGAAMGGPLGAATGAAVGAQVGMLRRSIGAWAEYKAALDKQRLALRLVIKDTNQYNKAQEFLLDTSRNLAIPQDVIVRQFTALTASVKGAGLQVNDAEKAFLAIASGIRGTGGSLEDMRAAMTATAQVFSKGKVSAEELRQQLGERLPGAFTIFAESMGKTPAELDKALEQGKVTLQDFMNFVDELTDRYKENAEELALAPATAGDRLAQAMSELKENLSGPIASIGAMFQNMATTAVKALNDIALETKEYAEKLTEETLRNQVDHFRDMVLLYDKEKSLGRDRDGWEKGRAMFVEKLANATKLYNEFINKTKESTDANTDSANNLNNTLDETINLSEKVGQTIRSGIVDAIEGAITGAKSLNEVLSGVLRSIGRMYLQAAVNKIPLPGLNANGNVYGSNGIVPFAKGGVVSQPTIFPYAKGGIGLMGEAGPEAIMPLKRGSDGRLGVEAKYRGGGGTTINYTGPTLNFNGDEYVPRSAVGEIIATATSQGAKAGESRTLRTLQNSRSSRTRIGL